MCVSGEEGAWTRTAPLRAPTVPQPLCWRWGGCPRRLRTNSIGALRVGGGVLPLPFSPRPEGRRGAGVGRAGGARGRGLGRPGPRREQHDRAVPLLPALGTARTRGSGTAAPRGPGGAERGCSGSGRWMGLDARGADGAAAFAPGRADWEQGELAGLDRYQDRL